MFVALTMAAGVLTAAPLPVPPVPADGVHDDAHLLADEQRAAIVSELTKARTAGLDAHVAIFSFIGSDTAKSLAERLESAWRRGERTLVIVYETGSGTCDRALGLPEDLSMAVGNLQEAFSAAAAEGRKESSGSAQLTGLVTRFVPAVAAELDKADRLRTQPFRGRARNIFLGVSALGGVIIVIGWFVQRASRSRLVAGLPPAFFPSVTVDARFGGAFGGGSVAEVTFRK